MYNIYFILLHISVILISIICFYLARIKNKKQIHYVFIGTIIFMLIWSLGYLLEAYTRGPTGNSVMFFVYLWYIGLCYTPVFILLTGIVYAKTKITFSYKYYLLFLIPTISYFLLLTNNYHHLFFVHFSPVNREVIFGKYFLFHSIYSYSCMLVGLGYLIFYSIKNSKFFSRQSILIVLGSIVPLLLNIAITIKIIIMPAYATAISFSFAIIFYTFAIFRFNFLSVAPIALQTIVDRISDCFLVINEEYQIIDFNKTILTTFQDIFSINRNINLGQLLEKIHLGPDNGSMLDLIEEAIKYERSVSYEKHIQETSFDRYFKIEITPIINKRNYIGTIILFKDTTDNVKAIETIEEKHVIMMEQERLASLGQLIGGIAHNLKTPIMSIAGAVEGLRDLVAEYEQSIGDRSVTVDDHLEIASEMRSWLDKIKPYCSYMSDIINTVKGQTIQSSSSAMFGFTVNELIKRVELLLKYELIRYNCNLNTTVLVDVNTEFFGDVNSLVQVFDNIIVNAIQAYCGKNGQIDLIVEKRDNDILFTIRDYARGIPEKIKNRLLKEMVTTKGKNGTGLGLYMSHSTIKGRFGGKMWFESEQGKGTSFFIQLPHKKTANVI